MKNIAFITDYSTGEYKGGGEYYPVRLAEVAREKGYTANVLVYSDFQDRNRYFTLSIKDADFIVLVNVGKYPFEVLQKISQENKCTKIEMDYGYCVTRNYMCANCKYLVSKPEDVSSLTPCINEVHIQRYRSLYENLNFITFVNPFEREVYRLFFGDMVNNSVLVFPLYCDEKKFWNMHRLRLPDSYFFAGRLYYEKGIDNVLNLAVQNPKVNFYFLGEGLPKYITRIANVGNCSYLGGFPDEREKMVEYYNMFENFVSLPVWMDTGPTKVVEAELCGCKLVLNDNNKIRTWNWKDVTECRKMIKESTDKFFERIEECIQ